MADATVKAGVTFNKTMSWVLPTGTWVATSQAWTGGPAPAKIADLSVTFPDGTNTIVVPNGDPQEVFFIVRGEATSTETWPTGNLNCDVRFKDNVTPQDVDATPTFVISVTRQVTRT